MVKKFWAQRGGQKSQKFICTKFSPNIVNIFRMTHIDALEVPPDALGPKRNEHLCDFNPRMVEKYFRKTGGTAGGGGPVRPKKRVNMRG